MNDERCWSEAEVPACHWAGQADGRQAGLPGLEAFRSPSGLSEAKAVSRGPEGKTEGT